MRLVLVLVVELLLVMVLLGYFTLLERKVLGYGQWRKGPNKAVVWGLFQPVLDGVKLFMKGYWGSGVGGLLSLWVFPGVVLCLVFVLWVMVSVVVGVVGVSYVLFYVLLLVAVVSYLVVVGGFLVGGKYSVLGSLRMLALVLSYEGVLVLSVFGLVFVKGGWFVEGSVVSFIGVVLLGLMVVSVVMESSRIPVDFVEGESEIVSGLTTEMGGLSFSFFFLAEYGVMSFFAVLLGWVVVGGVSLFGLVFGLLMIGVFCILRLSLPRSRYDYSMMWGWKVGLVVVFVVFGLLVGVMGV